MSQAKMKKQSNIAKEAKAQIAALDKQFDTIVSLLTDTPMTKAEYDEIENELRTKVEDFKYSMETL